MRRTRAATIDRHDVSWNLEDRAIAGHGQRSGPDRPIDRELDQVDFHVTEAGGEEMFWGKYTLGGVAASSSPESICVMRRGGPLRA